MVDYIKKYIRTIRLNSFHPLCGTAIGRKAIDDFAFPPFIDASCRREPDLQNPFPSITALCRQEIFAPKLFPNDIVTYMTVKGKWMKEEDHNRLVAVLEVVERKETHLQGRSWYASKNLPIPSNCMVDDNPPHNFFETAGNYDTQKDIDSFMNASPEKQKIVGERRIKLWDGEYHGKSKKWGVFLITKPIFVNLTDPPILTDQDLFGIFNKKINTRTPKKLTPAEFKALAKFANINFIQPH